MSAEPALENHENIAKILDSCQKNSKMAEELAGKVTKNIRTFLLCKCDLSLSDKLALREYTKTPELFIKLLSELSSEIATALKINPEIINSLTIINIKVDEKQTTRNVKPNPLISKQKTQVEKIAKNLLTLSGKKLISAISKVMLFLSPKSKVQINTNDISDLLIKTLSSFNSTELDKLEEIVNSKPFTKIVNKLDLLTETLISILKEDI